MLPLYSLTDSEDSPPNIDPLVLPDLSSIMVSFPIEAADNPPDVILVVSPVLMPIVLFSLTEPEDNPPK